MFANIYLEIEAKVIEEINSKFLQYGLEKGYFSLHDIGIDLIESEVEIYGFDKMKGEYFIINYNYQSNSGKLHYLNGEIINF
ncbi:hypothetical protein [Cytobacillus gottheilii]|uniref:hypothetical protein n=1 Tax=Cytobacillus gottheilii TaxID=859144 RepID=UPI0009B9362A|nr:hypothetical protein [Cytobacillus gottheilii]